MRAVWSVAMAGALIAVTVVYGVVFSRWGAFLGWDARHYFVGAQRFIETGTPYRAAEVAAPFTFADMPFIHPPAALYLFVPFSYIPEAVWWVAPIAGTACIVASMRPARWSWPLIVGLLAWPTLAIATVYGNTDLWMMFAVAAGLRFGWPALAVVAKPSMLPMMVSGIRHRSWWCGLGVVALACVPFGALWLDWLHVVLNSPGNLAYSLPSMVPMLAPVIAWAARTRPHDAGRLGPSIVLGMTGRTVFWRRGPLGDFGRQNDPRVVAARGRVE